MSTVLRYHATAERPTFRLSWYDDDDAVIDFSTASFVLKIGNPGSTALLTKTTGITGAATAPNITVAWTAGELAITPGTYTWQLAASTSSLERVCSGQIQIIDVVT